MERREFISYGATFSAGSFLGILSSWYNDREQNKGTIDEIKLESVDSPHEFGFIGFLSKETVSKLQSGGYVVYFRHEETQSGEDQQKNVMGSQRPDELPEWDFDDCRLQRNLTIDGWRRAEETSKAIEMLDISFEQAYSSPWCRCRKHAQLVVGDYTVREGLDYSKPDNSANLKELVKQSSSDKNEAIFGHSLESLEMTSLMQGSDRDDLEEGEAIVMEQGESSEDINVIDGPGFN